MVESQRRRWGSRLGMHIRNWRMRTKFAVLIVVVTVVAIGCTTAFNFFNSRQRTTAQLEESYRQEAFMISEMAVQTLEFNLNTLRMLALASDLVHQVRESNQQFQTLEAQAAQAQIETIDAAWQAEDSSVNNLIYNLENNTASLYLGMAQVYYPEQVEIFATDKQGVNVAMTDRTGDYYQADEEWWQTAYADGKGATYISSIQFDDSTQSWAFSMAVPIRDPNSQQVIGVLRNSVDVTELLRFLDAYQGAGEVQIAIVANDGTVIYDTTHDLVGETVPDGIQAVLAGGTATHKNVRDWLDRPAFIVAQDVTGKFGEMLGWTLMISIPRRVIDGQIAGLLLSILGVGLVVAVLMSLLGFWTARTIAGPLDTITRRARHLAEGDIGDGAENDDLRRYLDQRDEVGALAAAFASLADYVRTMAHHADEIAGGNLAVAVQPKDENDALGNAFQRMVKNLNELIGNVRQSAVEAAAASQQLNHSAEQVGVAAHQIAESITMTAAASEKQVTYVERARKSLHDQNRGIESIAVRAKTQAQAAQDASNTLTERLSPAIEQVLRSTDTSNRAVGEAGAAVSRGAATVADTVDGIESIAQATEQVNDRVTEMERRSQEIGAIVETIDEIAERTNLLALNAAIEAARAGEHGRGFAVVADEVRKLAEQSARSTQQITQLIESVQQAAQQAVAAMEQSRGEVQRGLDTAAKTNEVFTDIDGSVKRVEEEIAVLLQAIDEMRDSSEGLATVMETMTGNIQETAAAVEQIRNDSDRVITSIEDVLEASQENSAAAVQVSASAEEVSAQIEETVASADSLAQMSQQLRELIANFTLASAAADEASDQAEHDTPTPAVVRKGQRASDNGHESAQSHPAPAHHLILVDDARQEHAHNGHR